MADEEKDDWLDDIEDDEENSSELDQSDIDSLLSADDDSGSPDETVEEAAGATEDTAAEADSELDQSDIDSLLSEDHDVEPNANAAAGEDPSQDEIDQLFSEVDDDGQEMESPEDDPFQAEEIDFKDLAADSSDEDFALDESEEGFDAEEFGLDDDISDIPDIPEDDTVAATLLEDAGEAGDGEETEFLVPDEGEDDTGEAASKNKVALPAILKNRKLQALAGGCLVLAIAAVFMFRGKPVVRKPVLPPQPTAMQQPPPEAKLVTPPAPPAVGKPKPNTPPQVCDSELTLPHGDKALNINLSAKDAESSNLNYEILSLPEYGKLSGKAPNFIYTPNKDFPGHDNFIFRVSDGHNFSAPANVKITEASPAPLPAATAPPVVAKARAAAPLSPPAKPKVVKPKVVKSRKLIIKSQDKTYHLNNNDHLVINWKKLWSKANYLPFTPKVKVEIISSNLHGKLQKTNPRQYSYQTDKYFGGTETLKYRFRLAKLKSRAGELKLEIESNHPAPEIHLSPIAKLYYPGENVVIDASKSSGENRKGLLFSWQQVAGTPIKFEFKNSEKSLVCFVAPSTFNTITNPGPVVRLTITDKNGQSDERTIKIATHSRRHSAVWGSLATGPENETY